MMILLYPLSLKDIVCICYMAWNLKVICTHYWHGSRSKGHEPNRGENCFKEVGSLCCSTVAAVTQKG